MKVFNFATILVLASAYFTDSKAYDNGLFPTFKLPEIQDPQTVKAVDRPEVYINPLKVTIKGTYSDTGTRVFKSIPYAKPPVDDLRWKDPESPELPRELDASNNPNMCYQTCRDNIFCPEGVNLSEDCLYLNIYAPPEDDGKFPVMVFIHGGAFVSGYSALPFYDGDYIAGKTDTILVAINYRLGALGFLTYKDDSTNEIIEGNFGFKDQVMALQWIKDNIRFFGGDPDRITIFGESAGGSSVALHMTSEKSAKLFNQAIIESNPFSMEYLKVKKARELGKKLVEDGVHCDSIKCLRKKSAKEIVDAQITVPLKILRGCALWCEFNTRFQLLMPWAPIIDGKLLMQQPTRAFATNKLVAKVPFIIGTNSHEARLFYNKFREICRYCPREPRKCYKLWVKLLFLKEKGNKVIENYNVQSPHSCPNNIDKITELLTDYIFVCPARHAVKRSKYDDDVKKWVYIFDQRRVDHGVVPSDKYCKDYACHGDELPYVFHTTFGASQTHDEAVLQEIMVTYWTNFAHTGDPNIRGKQYCKPHSEDKDCYEVTWPEYTDSNQQIKVFRINTTKDVPSTSQQYPQQEKCNFFDTLNGNPDDAYNMCADGDC